MSRFIISKKNKITDIEEPDKITLITQFYICKDNEERIENQEDKTFLITKDMAENRNRELKDCLKKNVDNPLINKIILLNEKIYTHKELGVESKKIKQINLSKRMTYKDVFNHITGDHLKGYIIMCNSDIFFDETLSVIFNSDLKNKKRVLTPLRYEYHSKYKNLKLCKIFGPTSGTQDTWIFHVEHNVSKKDRKLFNINFGRHNCNSKVLYLLNMLGYELVNDPMTLKTYHHHKSKAREYDTEPLSPPFLYILPQLVRSYGSEYYPFDSICKPLKTDILQITNDRTSFCNDAERFHELINKNQHMIVSRTTSEYNKLIHYMLESGKTNRDGDEYLTKLNEAHIGESLRKINSDIFSIDTFKELQLYITLIIKQIQESTVMLFPSPITTDFRESANENFSILKLLKKSNNSVLANDCLSLTNKYDNKMWIELVKDKKILVLSENVGEIEKQKNNLENIWGSKVFENCEIITFEAPKNIGMDASGNKMKVVDYSQKYVNSIGQKFKNELQNIDMVLLGDTPFSWFIVYYFSQFNITTIDVGEELDMYFGLYSNELLEKYKDFLSVTRNKEWINVIC